MAENLMNKTVRKGKYSLPGMNLIKAQRYVVLPGQITEDYQNSKINTPVGSENIEGFLSGLTTTGAADQSVLLGLLKKMAQNERAKEVSFLVGLYSDPIFNSELKDLVEPLREAIVKTANGTMTSNDFTKIFTILEITEKGLKNSKDIIKTYKNAQLNDKFKMALHREIDKIGASTGVRYDNNKKVPIPIANLDMTELMYTAIKDMGNTTFDLNNPETEKAAYELANLVLTSQGLLPNKGAKTLNKDGHHIVKLDTVLKIRGTNKKDGLKGDTVKGQIDSALGYIMRGIGAEIKLALSNEGIGKIATSKKLTGFESINDVEMKVTIEGTFSENLKNSDVFNYDSFITQLQITENQIKAIKNKFKIAYSSKMYMPERISKENSDWKPDAIARDYKIVGSSTVHAKAATIISLNDSLQMNDLDSLLLMLNNTGTGALYENMKQEIGVMLATIAARWMFEKSEDMFTEALGNFVASNSSNETTLHIFFINGIYMPVSGILYEFISQLESKNRDLKEDAIKVSISDYNSLGYYKENIRENENIVGMHRWDQLKSQVENQTKMTVELNRTLLSKFLQF